MADASGRVVEWNSAAERTFGYTREHACGRLLSELIVPPSLRERHSRAFAHFIETGEGALFGQRVELMAMRSDGSEFPVELALSLIEPDPPLICGAVRDLSGAKQTEHDLRRLVEEQAALRRVATAVANDISPPGLFALVAEEVGQLLAAPIVALFRYDSDASATVLGGWGQIPYKVGADVSLDGPSVSATVRGTGHPARIDDWTDLSGSIADAVHALGVRSAVGAPILIGGETWGLIIATSIEKLLPPDTEARLSDFTSLIATSLSNAESRENVRRFANEQAALRRVAVLVAAGAPNDEIFAAVAEESARILDVEQAYVTSFESDGTSILLGTAGQDWDMFTVGARYPPHPGVNADVWRLGTPAAVEYERVPGEYAAAMLAKGMLSAVGVPIVVDGTTWGVVSAFSTRERPLPEDAEARLTAFTELLATAVSNAQARDDLHELAEEQAALRRVATLVAQGAGPEEVFGAVAEEIRLTLDLPRVEMARYEPDGGTRVLGSAGEHPFRTGTQWPLDGPTISTLIRETGQPARIDDYSAVPGTIAQAVREAGIRSGLGVPIVVAGRVWGMVATGSTDPEPLPAQTEARLAAFTELIATAVANAEARDDVRRLAEEQASLRRVATLVAEGASPADVFAAVAEEVAQVSGLPLVEIARFDPDDTLTVIGAAGAHPFQPGTRWPMDNATGSAGILTTRRPARIEYTGDLPGTVAEAARTAGIRWAVGVPIIVDGKVWGSIGAAPAEGQALPADAETRLIGFTELVATAVSNATTYSQLLASRTRIVTAGDEARRRIERNLHDGTQQRLLALGLNLQAIQATLPEDRPDLHSDLERTQSEIDAVLDEVRELSRGLHPALLSQGGIDRALRSLARRCPIPVALEIELQERPPESVEIAVYYVVSEALANTSKHARASAVSVAVTADRRLLRAAIRDDGAGGADASGGTGLIGLIDRVEALGGRFALDSPRGGGTTISIELPLPPAPEMAAPPVAISDPAQEGN